MTGVEGAAADVQMDLAKGTELINLPSDERLAPARELTRARHRRRRVVSVGEALLVWLVLLVVISRSRDAGTSLLASLLLAGVWVAGVRSFRRHVAHLEVAGGFLVDVVAATAATGVLVAVSTAWHLGVESILLVAVTALVVTGLWNWLGARLSANDRTVLFVGGRTDGVDDLLRILREDRHARFIPLGVIVENSSERPFGDVPVLGSVADLQDAVQEHRPDLIVVCVRRNRPEVFSALLEAAGSGFRVVGLPEFYEHAFGRLPVRQLTAAWFMSVLHLYQRPYSAFAKRVFDVVTASLILFVFAPLYPFLFAMIAVTPGSAIYRQTRMGANGRPFTIFKFRTMTQHAERDGLAVWAARGDARVTAIGRVLRRARLDELPQIVNVLRGDMSIVGPRPERPEFVAMLESEVPFWSRRHLIKPGITGWAQVRGGYASGSSETEEKLSYDLWYLRHASLLVDTVICLMTLPRILSGRGAR
jgi:exopolysaccharide biosynthesis polyprenyl glycosylphosphotransferase